MIRDFVLLFLIGLAVTTAHPIEQGEKGLDYVLQNLTAIWEELAYLRHEVDGHFHDGHEGRYHHKMMDEAATMNHERHVHHLHHPHESHNNHHDNDLLQHLAHHGLGKLHYPSQGDQQAEDDGDDGEDQSSEDDDSAESHQAQGHVHAGDAHDVHGLHSLGDYDLDAFNFQDLTAESSPHAHVFIHEQGFGQGSGHSHSHGYGSSHSHGHGLGHSHDHSHGSGYSHVHEAGVPHVHEAGVPHDHSHEPVPETQRQESPGSPKQVAPGRGLALIPGRESASTGPPVPEDPWMYAKCDLQPNVDVPESTVRGSIVISQLRSGKGPVYFDLKLSGFDVASTGRIHGFHVHERAVTDGSCGSTGGHFNPHGQTHGAQDASVRHVGDLGNIEVDENGNLDGHIVTDRLVAFSGPNNIISKAIVVHAGEDDLGLGGDSGSLATGNAGGRLACCNIHIKVVPYFRFKG